MTAETCQVRGCGARVLDGFVCQGCADQLAEDLQRIISGHQADSYVDQVDDDHYVVTRPASRCVQVGTREGEPLERAEIIAGHFARRLSSMFDHNGGLMHDLDATFDRQARVGSGGRASSETALVWHERAGDVRRQMTRTLARYAKAIADARGISVPGDLAETVHPLTLADWISRHVQWLRHQQAGAAAVTEIHRLVAETMHVIDRSADRWYAGPCTAEPKDQPGGYCGEDLYAKPDAPTVTCRRCGQRYDVPERRQWLVKAAEDQLAHAEWIGRAAASFGVDITPAAIRGYAHRGRIVAHGHDALQRPLYRIGDVIRVAEEIAARRGRKAAG